MKQLLHEIRHNPHLGNLTELVIALTALRAGQYKTVSVLHRDLPILKA